jgi:2-keto-4-pentenoate hydratase/2-oxohepta-3-ene-1,7-dioic acid hydratase in catechol pathway
MYSATIDPGNEFIRVNTVFCLGNNYAEHIREMGSETPSEPVIFIKPTTALADGSTPIVLPEFSNNVHYEIELVVMVDDVIKNISADEAQNYILAYGVGLDLTARDVQTRAKIKGLPWTIAKGFDGSAPISHFIRVENAIITPDTRLRLKVNTQIRQEDSIGKMIMPIPEILAYLSGIFTLRRGDLIFTGTPQGVGPLKPGDEVQAELVDIVSFATRVRQ